MYSKIHSIFSGAVSDIVGGTKAFVATFLFLLVTHTMTTATIINSKPPIVPAAINKICIPLGDVEEEEFEALSSVGVLVTVDVDVLVEVSVVMFMVVGGNDLPTKFEVALQHISAGFALQKVLLSKIELKPHFSFTSAPVARRQFTF